MRFKISNLMALTAIIGANIGWIRAFLLAERARGELVELFDCVVLIAFALQFGFWRYLRTGGRRRRFWLGFLVSAVAASVALRALFVLDYELLNWYAVTTSDLSYYCLPTRVAVALSTDHWDSFLAIIYFLPELLAALLGGLLAACLFRKPAEIRPVPAAA